MKKATRIMTLAGMGDKNWYYKITILASNRCIANGHIKGVPCEECAKTQATEQSGANQRGFLGQPWSYDEPNHRFVRYDGDPT